jgi:HEPN domain-containing protein
MGAAAPEVRGVAQIGFHAQQAVEKILKALLTAYGIEPEEQHSLGRLVEQVRRLDRQTADRISDVSSLTRYAVYHRYPPRVQGKASALSRNEVLGDLDRARRAFPILLAAVEARLAQSRRIEDG